jgi:hypothetical protein
VEEAPSAAEQLLVHLPQLPADSGHSLKQEAEGLRQRQLRIEAIERLVESKKAEQAQAVLAIARARTRIKLQLFEKAISRYFDLRQPFNHWRRVADLRRRLASPRAHSTTDSLESSRSSRAQSDEDDVEREALVAELDGERRRAACRSVFLAFVRVSRERRRERLSRAMAQWRGAAGIIHAIAMQQQQASEALQQIRSETERNKLRLLRIVVSRMFGLMRHRSLRGAFQHWAMMHRSARVLRRLERQCLAFRSEQMRSAFASWRTSMLSEMAALPLVEKRLLLGPRARLQIVLHDGDSAQLQLPLAMPVQELYSRLGAMTGILPQLFVLAADGEVLRPGMQLADYGLSDGDCVRQFVGGGASSAPAAATAAGHVREPEPAASISIPQQAVANPFGFLQACATLHMLGQRRMRLAFTRWIRGDLAVQLEGLDVAAIQLTLAATALKRAVA